jgi:type II secretory pathway pseudopilin PulG
MRRRHHNAGFTYVGLIVLVAIIGIVTAATIKLGSLMQRRAAEEALLDVGAAFADALKSYANASTPGQRLTPATLEELLLDPRFPTPRRHLRQIYADPTTGQAKWGLLRGVDKIGIVAVYSLSTATPIKLANFDPRFIGFDNKQHLSDWKFVATGMAAIPAPAPEGPPPQQPKMIDEPPPPAEPAEKPEKPEAVMTPAAPSSPDLPEPPAPPAEAPPADKPAEVKPGDEKPAETEPAVPLPGQPLVPKKK